jgi:hypothetical protein
MQCLVANPGSDLMKDKPQDNELGRPHPELHADGASQALSAALQKTFESLLEEPVPEKFQSLIAKIREAEAKKSQG